MLKAWCNFVLLYPWLQSHSSGSRENWQHLRVTPWLCNHHLFTTHVLRTIRVTRVIPALQKQPIHVILATPVLQKQPTLAIHVTLATPVLQRQPTLAIHVILATLVLLKISLLNKLPARSLAGS